MSPHQVIAVCVRLFAIWLAIYVARTVPAFYREAARMEDPALPFVIAGICILSVLLVLFLWLFPRSVAHGLLDGKSLAPVEASSPDTWFAVGCSLIGIWLIVPALSSVFYNLTVYYLAQRNSAFDTNSIDFAWAYYLVEIAFGVWLLLGARGARRLFWWARGVD